MGEFLHVVILELQIFKLHSNQIKILLCHHCLIWIICQLWCQKITMSTSREINGNSEEWVGREGGIQILN